MDFGVVLTSYHGSWDDTAFAEAHGFATAGFVDSPLLAGDPLICAALAADRTSRIRIGPLLAIPGTRHAAALAAGVGMINQIAPGRAFIGLGTGYTGRALFGRKPVTVRQLERFADACRGLLDGGEVLDGPDADRRPIRMRQAPGVHGNPQPRIPIYVGADGPRTLAIAGRSDGWVCTMKNADYMRDSAEVFGAGRAAVAASAETEGRTIDDLYTMISAAVCILEDGEPATSDRALERVGAYAMMAFHTYAENPAIAEHLPPAFRERIEIYEREVLSRLPVARDRFYQEVHRGHLSHLLDGEAEVLTEEIIRMTTITGTIDEVAATLHGLQAAGVDNITLNPPAHLCREIILEAEQRLMPLLAPMSQPPA